ncbi:LysE family translocator [Nitrincola sp. MINF-07-Sa-05]|uniref:LysE family translocator n=1 Tax=Nitrincola salilacus TaxID=3400273 RepID=UPI00391823AD
MIDMTILPVFVVATFFLVISPGPDLLLISTYSSARGFKAGLMISVGIFIAGLLQTLLVAFGLGQLMQAMPPLVWAVKIVGALYLSWLGLNLLHAWFKRGSTTTPVEKTKSLSAVQLIYQGLLNNLMNPKALLFFSMFLPQFTNAELGLTTQILVLGLLLSSIALFINTIFSLSFSKLGAYLGGKIKLGRHIDGILGVVFLSLAARLVASK